MFALLQALRHYPRIGLAPAIVLPQAITHLECYLPNAHPLVCWAPKFSQIQPSCNTKLVYNDCARLYISPLRCYNSPRPSPFYELLLNPTNRKWESLYADTLVPDFCQSWLLKWPQSTYANMRTKNEKEKKNVFNSECVKGVRRRKVKPWWKTKQMEASCTTSLSEANFCAGGAV